MFLREFRKRFRRKRPALFKSARWQFHQDNAPVHNAILVTDYLTKMGIMTVPRPPYSPDVAPCDFWLFPKLRGSHYQTTEMIETDEGHWHAHSWGLPWSIPKVFGTVQQVHCTRRRLLRSGLEFNVYTINKKCLCEKRLDTYLMILLEVPRKNNHRRRLRRLDVTGEYA